LRLRRGRATLLGPAIRAEIELTLGAGRCLAPAGARGGDRTCSARARRIPKGNAPARGSVPTARTHIWRFLPRPDARANSLAPESSSSPNGRSSSSAMRPKHGGSAAPTSPGTSASRTSAAVSSGRASPRTTSPAAGATASSTHSSLGATRRSCVKRVREHLDAGADHVCVQAISEDALELGLDGYRRLAPALLELW